MKKRSYKRLQNKLYKEIKRRSIAESRAINAEEEAKYYKTRFRAFGSNVDTVEPDDGKILHILKWELKPELWGDYLKIDDQLVDTLDQETLLKILADRVIKNLAKGLIERNLIQFIIRDPDDTDPLNRYGTFAAKIYVVPWEQVPHKRIVEMKQISDEILYFRTHLYDR